MPQSDNCPSELYHMMLSCWKGKPDDRSIFEYMQSVLNDFYTSSSSRTEQNCRICAGEEEERAEPTKMKS